MVRLIRMTSASILRAACSENTTMRWTRHAPAAFLLTLHTHASPLAQSTTPMHPPSGRMLLTASSCCAVNRELLRGLASSAGSSKQPAAAADRPASRSQQAAATAAATAAAAYPLPTVSVTVNGKRVAVPRGSSILEAAQAAGVTVPTWVVIWRVAPSGGRGLIGVLSACSVGYWSASVVRACVCTTAATPFLPHKLYHPPTPPTNTQHQPTPNTNQHPTNQHPTNQHQHQHQPTPNQPASASCPAAAPPAAAACAWWTSTGCTRRRAARRRWRGRSSPQTPRL